jgi:DNA-binding response OmpR family regulator
MARMSEQTFIGEPFPTINATILLLASDQLLRAVVQETLEAKGYVVISTGDLGTAVLRLKDVAPDLLIVRTYVETMPGHNAAAYLRTKSPRMRVMIMGGLLDDDRLRLRESLAGFDVFPKPYTAQEFLDKVKAVLAAPPH